MEEYMIELQNVSKYYNSDSNVAIGLRRVSLKFKRNEVVAITGASGSGKSTLLNVICGVDTYEEGEILCEGNETSYFNQEDMDAYRKKYVSFIYQTYNIIDSYSVLENVMLPLILKGMNKKDAEIRALEIIKRVGLKNRIRNRGTELSGGEKQRTVIARALAYDAPILACDEPTGNLDSETGKDIMRLLAEVSKDKLVLIVTHNYEQCKGLVTRTIKLHDGEVAEDYPCEQDPEALAPSADEETGALETYIPEVPEPAKRKYAGISFVTWANIKNTPKKNIFCCIVLLVLSFNFFFMIMLSSYFTETFGMTGSVYGINVPERTIVYYDGVKDLDKDELSGLGECYFNAFYEDSSVYFSQQLMGGLSGFVTMHTPDNINGIEGFFPENDGEIFVVFGNKTVYDEYKEAHDSGVFFYTDNLGNVFKGARLELNLQLSTPNKIYYDVTGFGYINNTDRNIGIIKSDDSKIFNSCFFENYDYTLTTNFGEEYGTQNINIKINPFASKTTIKGLPDGVTSVSICTKSRYVFNLKDFTNVPATGSSGTDSSNYIQIELRPEDLEPERIYECSIYSDDTFSLRAKLDSLGYKYKVPSQSNIEDNIMAWVILSFFIALSVMSCLLLTFICYLVMNKVYGSKKKDFAILRSLGVRKKFMAGVVQGEMGVFGLIASVATVLIVYTFGLINELMREAVRHMAPFNYVSDFISEVLIGINPIIFIVFFVFIQIFSNLIARRFNRKLFKFTVSSTIKEAKE